MAAEQALLGFSMDIEGEQDALLLFFLFECVDVAFPAAGIYGLPRSGFYGLDTKGWETVPILELQFTYLGTVLLQMVYFLILPLQFCFTSSLVSYGG